MLLSFRSTLLRHLPIFMSHAYTTIVDLLDISQKRMVTATDSQPVIRFSQDLGRRSQMRIPSSASPFFILPFFLFYRGYYQTFLIFPLHWKPQYTLSFDRLYHFSLSISFPLGSGKLAFPFSRFGGHKSYGVIQLIPSTCTNLYRGLRKNSILHAVCSSCCILLSLKTF